MSDGTVYLDSSSDGFCHWIPDGYTLNALGYDWNTVTWYGDLPCTLGDPLPAIAPPPTPAAPVETRATESATVVTPLIGKPLASPTRAVAGKTFTVSFPVTRSDTGDRLTSGSASVVSSIGGASLKSSAHFSNGTASVKLTLPGMAHGKLLALALTVSTDTTSASRTVTFRVA
ncbi:MAG: hypothetical protein JOY72_11310 [Actinobacteria bacterium]|nr:hypothetical protein [Actinomycetota bacterium]